MKELKKRMIIPRSLYESKGNANNPLNSRDLYKMINAMADAIEELQVEVIKMKDK